MLETIPAPCKLARAISRNGPYLSNEDPWVLRSSQPIPDGDLEAWPNDQELGEMAQKLPDYALIQQQLVLLATQHRVPTDEVVIAARVQAFTWREDIIFRLWCAETDSDPQIVRSSSCPSTLSGRTFGLNLSDWWEPGNPAWIPPSGLCGWRATTAYLVFSQNSFRHVFWKDEFGWMPSPDNPLVWLAGDQPVARYERFHGTLRSTHSGHPRQPLLCRWLVKRKIWEKLETDHGPFRLFNDFERFESDAEQ